MKISSILLVSLVSLQLTLAQSIIINSGASIYVPAGADICAESYGNISGNIYGEGTQCGQLPVPVELQSFTAIAKITEVILKWKTATEVNNYGFNIERNLKENWETIGFVEGNGNSNSPKSYSFIDKNPVGGSKFKYRLKQIDTDGQFEYSNVVEVEIIPQKYELYQNYPNPFNPVTNIKFSLPRPTQLKIILFNSLGEKVATLVDGMYEMGYHKIIFNSNNLSSGTYLYRIESSEFVQVKKLMIIK